MMEKVNVIDTCKNVLARHNLEFVKLKEFKDADYIMAYTPREKTIKINEQSVEKAYNTLIDRSITSGNKDIPLYEDFIEIIFYHELGHYLDPEINTKIDEISINEGFLEKGISNKAGTQNQVIEDLITLEQNAWRIAEALIASEMQLKYFKQIKDDSLRNSRTYITVETKRI